MRNLPMEAAIWNLFTSAEFFEAAANECDQIVEWFGSLAVSRKVANFGRNNQIYDSFRELASDFRKGAEIAKLGDYEFIWRTASCVSGDIRGIMEQPLHSWMSEAEYQEFGSKRIDPLLAYAGTIKRALNNALSGADSFFEPDPDCPERSNDDDGFPGNEIIEAYEWHSIDFEGASSLSVPDPLPECVIDRSVACRTGEEVPWTGVWYPATGLERHSLAFAIKGLRMQPVFRIVKTVEELERENEGVMIYSPETLALATTWHPVVPSGLQVETDKELRAKAGESCPKAGVWQPMDAGAEQQRTYQIGEMMANLGSAYGITVWRWMADR